jgi:hypothetical protein
MVNRNSRTRASWILAVLTAGAIGAGCAVESSAPTDVTRSSPSGEKTATTDEAMKSIGFCQADCPGDYGDIEYEACLQDCMGEGGGGGDEGSGGGGGHPSCQPRCSQCQIAPGRGSERFRTCMTATCDVKTISCGGRGSPVVGGKRPGKVVDR